MSEQNRGELTDRIKAKSKELLGYEIGTEELRFMAYVQYVMVNEQRLDIRKVSGSEREILSGWKSKKYVDGGASSMSITKEFWDAISEIIYLGYVDLSE